MTKFKVNWDNGKNDCGTFSDVFDTEAEAEKFGNDWVADMESMHTPEERTEMDETGEGYTFDVIEVDVQSEDEEASAAEEQSLDYFNRYIAGDR